MLHASPSSTREQQRITAVNSYKFNRSIEDTARFVKRSARWVEHWVDRDQQTGSVTDAPRSGRPTKLSQAAISAAQALVKSKSECQGCHQSHQITGPYRPQHQLHNRLQASSHWGRCSRKCLCEQDTCDHPCNCSQN
jgi:hypothetical protein